MPEITCEEESIVSITSWMLLRLKQSIKIPKAALDIVIGRHLLKPHLDKDLAELTPDLQSQILMQ